MLNKSGARMQNEGLGRDAIAIFIMVFPITLPEPIGGGVFFFFFSFLFLACFFILEDGPGDSCGVRSNERTRDDRKSSSTAVNV